MPSLFLPERFIARPVSAFVPALEQVTAWYWSRHAKGDITQGTDLGLGASGAIEAMHWIAGMTPFAPCYTRPLERTRSNLLKLTRYAEMALAGEGEQLDREDSAALFTDPDRLTGARSVYYWALRMNDNLPGSDLLPEEIQAARRYYLSRNTSRAA